MVGDCQDKATKQTRISCLINVVYYALETVVRKKQFKNVFFLKSLKTGMGERLGGGGG
jgi:hypothetical protein